MSESNKDPIKEAFAKAKQDILSLASEIESLKREIQGLKQAISNQTNRQTVNPTHSSTENPTQNPKNQAIQHINPTQNPKNQAIQHINPTQNPSPTHNLHYKALKSLNSNISTGNEGVPTDRQTDQQTDNSTRNEGVKVRLNREIAQETSKISKLTMVAEVLNSLDDIKKELRLKLKKLTQQELVVFTTIYQLEEESFIVDYSLLSQKLQLTESSIRDYTQRILKKGLPLEKTKENNKKILLKISPELRKIASLTTILQLREL